MPHGRVLVLPFEQQDGRVVLVPRGNVLRRQRVQVTARAPTHRFGALRGEATLGRGAMSKWRRAPLDATLPLPKGVRPPKQEATGATVGAVLDALAEAPRTQVHFELGEDAGATTIAFYAEDAAFDAHFGHLLRALAALAPFALDGAAAEFEIALADGSYVLELLARGARLRRTTAIPDSDLIEALEAQLDRGAPKKRAPAPAPSVGPSHEDVLAVLARTDEPRLLAAAEASGARMVLLPLRKALPTAAQLLAFLDGSKAMGVAEPVRAGIALRLWAELDPARATPVIEARLRDARTPLALRAELVEAIASIAEPADVGTRLAPYVEPRGELVLLHAAARALVRLGARHGADLAADAILALLSPQRLAAGWKESAAFRGGPKDPPTMAVVRALIEALGETGSPRAVPLLAGSAARVKGQLVHNWALALLRVATDKQVKQALGVAKRSFVARNVVSGRLVCPPGDLLAKLADACTALLHANRRVASRLGGQAWVGRARLVRRRARPVASLRGNGTQTDHRHRAGGPLASR